jgi:molybdopterin-guanine dinucleotide biosynthesis protein A
MQAVVMAAGEGRRMRPVSERWPKPVLRIDGRPVIGTLLRALAEAGVERATVVTGYLAEQVEKLVGDGAAFGVTVSYAHQPEPLGSADAVLRAAAEPPFVVTAADTLFAPGDLARFLAESAGADGAIAGRRDPPPSPPHRSPLRIVEGRVERVLDDDPENPIGGAPLWLVGPAVARFLDPLPGKPPYELAAAFQLAIDSGAEIRGVEIGPTRDLTSALDLVKENFPYLEGT